MKKLLILGMFLSLSGNLWATSKVLVNVVVTKGSSDSYQQTYSKSEVCNNMVEINMYDMTKLGKDQQNHELEKLNINCKITLDNGQERDVIVYAGAGAINLEDKKTYTYSAFAKAGDLSDQVYKLSNEEFGKQETLTVFKELDSTNSSQEWFLVTFNFFK